MKVSHNVGSHSYIVNSAFFYDLEWALEKGAGTPPIKGVEEPKSF